MDRTNNQGSESSTPKLLSTQRLLNIMAKTRSSKINSKRTEKITGEKSVSGSQSHSRVFATRTRQTRITNCTDACADSSGRIWGLLSKVKCDRRETIVFVCFLPTNGDRQLKDYQKTIDELKLRAKKTRCARLTDSLEIVEIEGASADPTIPWWNQLFNDDREDFDTDHTRSHNQLVYFGRERAGIKKDDYYVSKTGKDTALSLFLHQINNCNSIEDIVKCGIIPDFYPNQMKISLPNDFHDDIIAKTKKMGFATIKSPPSGPFLRAHFLWMADFLLNNSITRLHFQKLKSAGSPTIAAVRFVRASSALWNIASKRNARPSSLNNNQTSQLYSKPSIVSSKIHLSKNRVAEWTEFLSTFFDMTLGIVVCSVLLSVFHQNHQILIRTVYLDAKEIACQKLENQIAWLETFPVGFKLNVELTHNMGYGIRSLLHYQKQILAATLWDFHGWQDYLIPAFATLAGLGGWTAFLAALIDFWRFEIFHVTLLSVAFRKLYQAELYLLSALFRLFRGKKRNALRYRTDSMQYDAMQLLVGTIAFCVCVFLWTTVMVYYTFFAIWNLLMHFPLLACSALYLLSQSFPWGSAIFRFLEPHWFPVDIFVNIHDESDIKFKNEHNVQVCNLETILESPMKIIFDPIAKPLKRLLQWYAISFFQVLFPLGKQTSYSFLPLTLLTEDDPKPDFS